MSIASHNAEIRELLARKDAEREQIARDIRAGVKSRAEIAREHRPLGDLGKHAVILYELDRPLV